MGVIEDLLGGAAYDPGGPAWEATFGPGGSLPEDPYDRADVGIWLRDNGDYERAEAIFQELIDHAPDLVFGWQEMAILRKITGRRDEAEFYFRRALEIDPADLLIRKKLAFLLMEDGRLQDALGLLRAHPSGDMVMNDAVLSLVQYVEFLLAYPIQAAMDLTARFETSGHYVRAEQVGERIRAAAEARTPFSLIRLGDGEGAWLPVDAADEARFAQLYETNRRSILIVWFQSDALLHDRAFGALRGRMHTLVHRADIVGIPYGLRLAHEYNTLSIRGAPSCFNLLRNLAPRLETANPGSYCGQDIHLELHKNGFFRDLLTSRFTFGLISCHAGLGYLLATRLGTRVVRAMVVPEERSFSQIAGASGMTRPHYPHAFLRIMDRLGKETRQAEIWLVAAGYLGKIYCDEIREAGGVAVDIGSIVDGWCGKVTRPTMSAIEQFQL